MYIYGDDVVFLGFLLMFLWKMSIFVSVNVFYDNGVLMYNGFSCGMYNKISDWLRTGWDIEVS